jgi:DeoR family transcriptional regulator, fructose operon transcriptional repressor
LWQKSIMATELGIEDRRAREAELLKEKGFMSLLELISHLGVSESTVRRDLEVLEEQGTVRRTHGGAVYVKETGAFRLAFADRQTTAAAEKEAIARAVAEMIPVGGTVIIDGGTTCYQVARAIQGRRLNVITNSLPIATLLSADMMTEVTLIGGYLYPRTGVALGAMAEQQLAALHGSRLILSCAGFDEEGAFNANQMMVDLERRMMRTADETILAIDHTKIGCRSVVKLCDASDIDVIVTDDGLDSQSRKWLEALPGRLVIASSKAS